MAELLYARRECQYYSTCSGIFPGCYATQAGTPKAYRPRHPCCIQNKASSFFTSGFFKISDFEKATLDFVGKPADWTVFRELFEKLTEF
jgi:hypothetical protein